MADNLKKTVLIEFVTKGDDKLDKLFKGVDGKIKSVGSSSKESSSAVEQLASTSKSGGESMFSSFFKANLAIEALKLGFTLTVGAIKKGVEIAVASIKQLVSWSVQLGKTSVNNAMQMEKYESALRVMLGTADKAKNRLAELSEFAAKTPFELPQVIELGNQLQALGRYSKENMTILGDLAAASGKPIEQVTGAFAKLVSGQKGIAVDMFRDLLITTDDWVKATGKGVSKSGEMLATTEDMLRALPKIIGAKGFSGMMAEQSKTLDGIFSNLRDTWTRFTTEFAQKTGLFDFVKESASGLLSFFSEWSPKVIEYVIGVKNSIAQWWNENQAIIQPKIEAIKIALWGEDGNGGLKGAIMSLLFPSDEMKKKMGSLATEGLSAVLDNLPMLIDNITKLMDLMSKSETIDTITTAMKLLNGVIRAFNEQIKKSLEYLDNFWNNKAWELIGQMSGGVGTPMSLLISNLGKAYEKKLGDITGRKAVGGLVNQTGSYIVGEHRPEQVILPRGAKVEPQVQASAGQTINVSINAPVYGVNDLKTMVISAITEAQRNQNYLSRYNLL